MNTTLEFIRKKYNVDVTQKGPIVLPHVMRRDMAINLRELGFKKGVEVGVAQGYHSRILCEELPGAELYGVDIWDLYEGYNEYTNRIHKYYLEALDRMKDYPNYTFIKKFSMDAVKDFEDGSLDFVYLDGAHDYYNVAMDICQWSKKVKKGGIIYGHDYKRRHHRWIVDVKDVVDSFTYAKAIQPLFIIGAEKLREEGGRSWMLVRQDRDLVNYQYKLVNGEYVESNP